MKTKEKDKKIVKKIKKDKKADKTKKNKMKSKSSIRIKLQGAFLLPVLFIILLGVITFRKSSDAIIHNYETATLQTINMTSNYISLGMTNVKARMEQIASMEAVQRYFGAEWENDPLTENTNYKEFRSIIQGYVMTEPIISDVFIYGDYGNPITLTSLAKSPYEQVLNETEGDIADKGIQWIGVHPVMDSVFEVDPEGYGLSLAKRLKNRIGKNVGYIYIDLSKDFILEALSDCEFPQGSIVGLVTSDGKEIVISEDADFSFSANQLLLSDVSTSGYHYCEYNGNTYLMLYSPVEESNSVIYTLIPKTEVIKQIGDIKTLTIGIVAITVILAFLVGLFMANGISKTIKKVNRSLENIASGDLTEEISIKRKDEFKILGQSINNMAENMKKLIINMKDVSSHVMNSSGMIDQVNKTVYESSQTINLSVNEIEQGSVQQAESAQNCLGQMELLAGQITEVMSHVENMKIISNQTKQIIEQGMQVIEKLIQVVGETALSTTTVINSINDLEDKSNLINSIVDTISDISSETSLLSLNASIEAARAGQEGRGFAVVAGEIEKMAKKSEESLMEISNITNEISKQTKVSVSVAETTCNAVEMQKDTLDETSKIFGEITKNVDRLFDSLEVIIQDIKVIDGSKDGTLYSIEEISAASQETSAAIVELRDSIGKQTMSVESLNESINMLSNDACNLSDSVEIFKV